MNKNFKDLPLRSGVGIVLLNKENKVFVAKRIDNPKNFWQMPQGGVDEGEDNLKAAFRELKEETSIKSVELIKELDGTLTYDLPDRLLGIIWKGKYKGQKQKWFLMRFIGNDNEINIPVYRKGIPDVLVDHASPDQSKEKLGLMPDQMADKIVKKFKLNN